MRISGIQNQPSFKANISKNLMPIIARAKGTCPLHKKPLLYDAIRIIETTFPDNSVLKNNKEAHLSVIGFFKNHVVLTKLTDNSVDDVRAIASGLDYLKIGLRKYSPPTSEQKAAIQKFREKWGAFLVKRREEKSFI